MGWELGVASRLGGGELLARLRANINQRCSTNFGQMPTFALVGNKPSNLWGFMLIMHGPNSAGSYWTIYGSYYRSVRGLGNSTYVGVYLLWLLSLCFSTRLYFSPGYSKSSSCFFPVTFDFSFFYWLVFNRGKKAHLNTDGSCFWNKRPDARKRVLPASLICI